MEARGDQRAAPYHRINAPRSTCTLCVPCGNAGIVELDHRAGSVRIPHVLSSLIAIFLTLNLRSIDEGLRQYP